MNAKLKKVLTIIGAIAIGIVGVLLGRGFNRRGSDRDRADIDTVVESLERSDDATRRIVREVHGSRAIVDDLSDSNEESKADAKRIRDIIRAARERTKSRGNTLDDNGGRG